MTVKTVTIARLINTGHYENYRVELSAELAAHETPEGVARELALLAVRIGRAELARRIPDPHDRRYSTWFEVGEPDDQGVADADRAAPAVQE